MLHLYSESLKNTTNTMVIAYPLFKEKTQRDILD